MEPFIFVLGLSYCIFYFLFPFIFSIVKTPQNYEWVPVNNQHRLPGDDRIYAALVGETSLNFFKYNHPCAPEIGNMAIDFVRVSSYRTASLLGLFLPTRLAYLISFLFSILIQYCLIFFISIKIFNDSWLALLVSLLTIFWFKTLTFLDLPGGITHIIGYIKKRILNSEKDTKFDLINDNFRYVVISVAGIYSWITIALILYTCQQHDPYILYLAFLLYFLIIPFVYPSVSAISVFVLSGSIFLQAFINREYNIVFVMCLAGVTGIIVLIFFGVISRIKAIFNSNTEVLLMSHSVVENYKFTWKSFCDFLLKRALFILPVIFCVVLVPKMKSEFSFLPFSLFFFASIKLVGYILRKNSIIHRFIERGGLHFLFFVLVCSVIFLAQAWGISQSFLDAISIAVLIPATTLPLIGCIRMGLALQKSSAFYMPSEEWEVYQFVRKKTKPRSMILAFSFSNIQLLPVYTHSNLYIRGAEWLESPEQELIKYIKAVKFARGKLGNFFKEFENYFIKKRNALPTASKSLTETDSKGVELINTLTYFPYVTAISGILMANNNKTAWTSDFLGYLQSLFSETNENLDTKTVDYVLVDKEDFLNIQELPDIFTCIFSNRKYTLFAKTNQICDK